VRVDHVLIAAADLGRAAEKVEARHGLVALQGGRHPGWGTANRIVPLGDAYLELVAVADDDEAAASPFGRWVAGAPSGRPLGWAVRTDRLDEVARRHRLTIASGSRERRDGRVLRWRLAGVEQAAAEPALPFFIEWGAGTELPGRSAPDATRATLARIELRGDADRLAAWLGPHELPVAVRPGAPAVTRIVLRGPAGEIVLA
jgi:hypothetical protein